MSKPSLIMTPPPSSAILVATDDAQIGEFQAVINPGEHDMVETHYCFGSKARGLPWLAPTWSGATTLETASQAAQLILTLAGNGCWCPRRF
jgi:hypothetical protein